MKVKNRSKKIIKFLKNRQGTSVLLLVFIIISLLSLLVLSLQLLSILSARRANQFCYSETAFFAAEGALYETIQHLRNDPNWPDLLPNEAEFTIGEAEIKRIITESEAGTLRIDINADNMGAKRRLSATFSRSTGERAPLDIILVIDRSGSMAWTDGTHSAAYYAKQAARTFIERIEEVNEDIIEDDKKDRIGMVSFATTASDPIDQSLTEDYDDVIDQVNNLPDFPPGSGYTNTAQALKYATEELQVDDNPGRPKIIILLSDGVASVPERCEDNECLRLDSGYEPDNQGNPCSDDSINQADVAKNLDYTIFSILLSNFQMTACGDLDSTITLGRLTLLRVSSEEGTPPLNGNYTYYKETGVGIELENIYAEIAQKIISPEFFEIKEEIPEPD